MVFHSRTGLRPANCVFMESGSDACRSFGDGTNNNFWILSSGSASSDSLIFYTGGRSIKLSGDGSNGGTIVSNPPFSDILNAGRFYFRIRFNFVSWPANITFAQMGVGGGNAFYTLNINGTTGAVQLFNDAGVPAQLGTDSTTIIANGSWYTFCVAHTWTNQNINEVRVYINGNLQILSSNGVMLNPARVSGFSFTTVSHSGSNSMNIDDVYLDDADNLQDCGDIIVTNKRPKGNNINNFNLNIGNNPSNRWENVNEQPENDANGWQESSGGPYPINETYGIENYFEGDVDLTGWLGVYPNTLPAVGMQSDSSNGINFYEAGMQLAFLTSSSSLTAYMSWAKCSPVLGNTLVQPLIWINGETKRAQQLDNFQTTTKTVRFVTKSNLMISFTPKFVFHSIASNKPFEFHNRP